MNKNYKPQIYPTKLLKSSVEKSLQFVDKIPLVRKVMAREYKGPDSTVPLTIVIPLHEKDFWIAKHALACARKNVKHPIEEIVVVTPDNSVLREWAEREGIRWVCEDDLLSWSKEEILELLPEHAKNRHRWIFQQLLKFSAATFIKTEALLVLDADTLLLKPKVFKIDDELWMDYSHERNLLYLQSYESLLGKKASSFISYVCHHMFMELSILEELKREIETQTQKAWDVAILELAAADFWTEKQKQVRPFNYFSEYETYGNFAKDRYKTVHSHYFRNYAAHNFDQNEIDMMAFVAELPKFYQWASFHSYNQANSGKKDERNGAGPRD